MKFVFVLSLVLPFAAHAARINVDYFKKYYVSEKGFQLSLEHSGWLKSTFEKKGSLEMVFQTEKKSTATLTIRVDEDSKSHSLESYIKTWVPKFAQFGLDVQNSQYFKLNPTLQSFIVDLVNSSSGKYVRQVIFYKNKKAVIFTCMDNAGTFQSTVRACNNLIKTFSWVQDEVSTSPHQG